jgi:6-phosphogluconate dehydrogenase
MKCGVIGLGRMGGSLAYRAVQAGIAVVGFDRDERMAADAARCGVQVQGTLQELAVAVELVWLMVPAGDLVDTVLQEIMPHLKRGAIIIDGGNSHFKDSLRRAQVCAQKGIYFLDCGTSGGLHGRHEGFCLMIGGDAHAYEKAVPLFAALAAPGGFGRVGPSGAGHYVKMVHNGIEYGIMQAYAEGLQLMKEGSFQDAPLDLAQITGIWNHGSIIRSWLLTLSHDILQKDQTLATISGTIQESGMGKWTVDEAHQANVPVPVIENALKVRAQSRLTGGNFATKMVAMMRNAFGGHAVGPKSDGRLSAEQFEQYKNL